MSLRLKLLLLRQKLVKIMNNYKIIYLMNSIVAAFFIASCASRMVSTIPSGSSGQQCCDNIHNCENESIIQQLEDADLLEWWRWDIEWSGEKIFAIDIDGRDVIIFKNGVIYAGRSDLKINECHMERVCKLYKKVQKGCLNLNK